MLSFIQPNNQSVLIDRKRR